MSGAETGRLRRCTTLIAGRPAGTLGAGCITPRDAGRTSLQECHAAYGRVSRGPGERAVETGEVTSARSRGNRVEFRLSSGCVLVSYPGFADVRNDKLGQNWQS